MRPLSVAEQDKYIRDSFPSFRLVFDGIFVGAWEGEVTPIARTYRIGILYYPQTFYFETCIISTPYVTVRVLQPPISLDPRGTRMPPPHVYHDTCGPDFSLCLFDPRNDEWLPNQPIAATIIPWACEWLFYYEGWLLTGEWAGGERTPQGVLNVLRTDHPSQVIRIEPFTQGSSKLAG